MAGSAATRAPRSWFWLQGLVCGGAVATAPGTALMALVLLAPSGVAYVMDAAPGRPHFRVIALLGAASTFAPMLLLWERGGSVDAALDLLGEPARPLLSWFCCGAGWLLTELAQVVSRLAVTAREARTIRLLDAERAQLAEEWMDAKPPPG